MSRTVNSIKAVQQGLPFIVNIGVYFDLTHNDANRTIESTIEYTRYEPTGGAGGCPKVYGKIEAFNILDYDSQFTFTIAALILKSLIPEGKEPLFNRMFNGSTEPDVYRFDSEENVGEYVQCLYDDGMGGIDGETKRVIQVGWGSDYTLEETLIEYEISIMTET